MILWIIAGLLVAVLVYLIWPRKKVKEEEAPPVSENIMSKPDNKRRIGERLAAATNGFLNAFFKAVDADGGIEKVSTPVLVKNFELLYAANVKILKVLASRGFKIEELVEEFHQKLQGLEDGTKTGDDTPPDDGLVQN